MQKLVVIMFTAAAFFSFLSEKNKDSIYDAVDTTDILSLSEFMDSDPEINSPQEGRSETLLAYAIKKGNFIVVEYLVSKGVDIYVQSNGMTPLMYAAKYNRPKIANYLLDNGGDIQKMNSKEETAYRIAIKNEAIEVIRVFDKYLAGLVFG